MTTEIAITSQNADQRLLDLMMDVENAEPLMMRLNRAKISKGTLKDIVGQSTFEDDLYDECRGTILLPAMAKILHGLVHKAAGGNLPAMRTYLELMKRLNTKADVEVNILQYKGLSDSEIDRRLKTELARHGIDTKDPIVDGEFSEEETVVVDDGLSCRSSLRTVVPNES